MSIKISVEFEIKSIEIMRDTLKQMGINYNEIDNDEIHIKKRWNDIIINGRNSEISYSIGTQAWYLSGRLHREDGPAFINSNGTQTWYLNGRFHRLNGPAVIYFNGFKSWYLNNISVDGETYQKIENSSKEELLVYMINPEYKDYLPLIEYRLNQ